MQKSVEELLREAADKASLLRATANLAATSSEFMDSAALSGFGDVCTEVADNLKLVRKALSADALNIEVRIR
jgi:hypothetical protein